MAEIYALPISDHSTTDTEFRKELLKKHKANEIMSYDLALNKLKEHGTEINQKWKKDSIKKIETTDGETNALQADTAKDILDYIGYVYWEMENLGDQLDNSPKNTEKRNY